MREEQPTVAALFPGQGVEPSRDETEKIRPDLVEALDDLLGRDAFADAHRCTASAQPAIYCASLALWSTHESDIQLFAGHSLGELTALAAAGWMNELDGLRLVVRRGALMEDACAHRAGGMLVALGIATDEAIDLAATYGVSVAGDNSPGQVVLSGESPRLNSLATKLRASGVPCQRLPVAGAFHSSLMEPAVGPFRVALSEMRFTPRRTRVLSANTLTQFSHPSVELAAALTRPVRWREAQLELWDAGARSFAAIGPGKALAGMTKRTLPKARLVELPA
jgi:malonyl CoA-acyl carrier protein transacylase